MPHFNIKDSVAFVTGTNKPNGIGRAVVHALLQEGAKKVYATARDASQLEDLVAQYDGNIIAVSLDVTDKHQVEQLGSKYPDVTLVVNNAGYFSERSTLDGIEYAEKEIAINYIAPMAIVKSFSPSLINASQEATEDTIKGSAVVNIASIASFVNFPLGATYSASKAASHSLTQGQRRDLPGSLVVGVYPGPIDTDMAENVPMDKTSPSEVAKVIANALKSGTEDVFPDPMSVQMHEGWKMDAKALEKQMAQPQGVSA